MPLGATVRVGLESLRGNPLRTLLATSGVVIGVAALVAVLALGDGLERLGRSSIERASSLKVLEVEPQTVRSRDRLLVPVANPIAFGSEDLASLREALPQAEMMALRLDGAVAVRLPSGGDRYALAVGTVGGGAIGTVVEHGRWLTDAEADSGAAVVVLSADLADSLGGPATALGQQVRVGQAELRVVGVESAVVAGVASRVYLPIAVARDVIIAGPRPGAASIAVLAPSIEAVDSMAVATRAWAAARWPGRGDEIEVRTSQSQLEQLKQGILVFKLFLGAITGISLLVGGIGITNVLLASVTERTREIGIRKATGAGQQDIRRQFLAESVSITGAGAVVGVIVGLLLAWIAATVIRRVADAPLTVAVTPGTVAFAAGVTVLVGLLAGTYPARRAARLSPIDAIRHE